MRFKKFDNLRMKNLIIFLLMLAPSLVYSNAVDILTGDSSTDASYEPFKSHWFTSFGFDTVKYDPEMSDYDGLKRNFKDQIFEEYGARLGFGREIYLGGGVFTGLKVEGFYNSLLMNLNEPATRDNDDLIISETRKVGLIYGVQASMSLSKSWQAIFKNPILDERVILFIEPFVEGGLGYARAFHKIDYYFNVPATTDEFYEMEVEDKLALAHVATGINLTSTSGYFFFLKGQALRTQITDRAIRGRSLVDGGAIENVSKNENSGGSTMMLYSLGGGYKF
jgi:hypothetical protein